MKLSLAAKFGVLGSIGFIIVGLVMFAMIREVQTGVEAGTLQGDLVVLLVVIGGTLVGMVFLFTLIGEYVDRELAARGHADAADP